MNEKLLKLVSLSLLVIFCTIFITGCNNGNDLFLLEDEYYGNYNQDNPFLVIENQELNNLIEEKKSFAIFIYQPMCISSNDFEQVLADFTNTYEINFYKIAFSNIKDTTLGEKVKYYPSFAIFKEGKLVDYLEPDKDEDIEYYKSSEGFKKWFTKYVELKKSTNNSSSDINQDNEENSNQNNIDLENEKIELDNVVREENKVNIYFFWGNGCPHGEEEMKFFESIEKEYGKYYNLYKFETWYDEENARIFSIFANAMGDNANGVPYTIIGERSFSGFGGHSKEEFLKAIEEQYKNNYDVYFDEIKK